MRLDLKRWNMEILWTMKEGNWKRNIQQIRRKMKRLKNIEDEIEG
jgi:hypothetical protein